MLKQFQYINHLKGDIANLNEYDIAYDCYRHELMAGNIDGALVDYINFFFASQTLIPIFSCSGHPEKHITENTKGYIIFRSLFSIEETLKIFQPIIKLFNTKEDFNLAIHYWENDAIGYYLTFATNDLQPVLEALRKRLCTFTDSYL